MNYYVVVEGVAEKSVYSYWVNYLNPRLTFVSQIEDVIENNFYIVSAYGYPQYFNVIDDAISDINSVGIFGRLVICVDSEDLSREEKIAEIRTFLNGKNCRAEIRIVIQHFCFDTWGLGNIELYRPHPGSPNVISFIRFFNTRINDPENLPSYLKYNRSQFAKKYLMELIRDRYSGVFQSQDRLNIILLESFFNSVKGRYERTGHIASFSSFLDAFV
jgi:hypothetical protein